MSDPTEQEQHDSWIEAQRAEFDIDEGIPEVPDITRGLPVIDIEDPLLPAFSYQHDLRERFLQALREAVVVLREIETITLDNVDQTEERIGQARSIIDEALDPEAIARWNLEGRPLPSIPSVVSERGALVDSVVSEVVEAAGLARFNVWGYDPENDHWAIVDELLNVSEAREALSVLEEDPRGMEYLMLPVGDVPRPE